MPVWPGALAAAGAVAAGLAFTLLLLLRGERRRDDARVVGDDLLAAAGEILGATFQPAAPRSRTGYRAAFGALHGSAEGLTYAITVNDHRSEDVGHAACITIQAPASFAVKLSASRLAPPHPGVTMADLFGRRTAQRIPEPAAAPLLRIVAVSGDFGIAERSLVAHSRPTVWHFPDRAGPARLADFATEILTAARQLLRSD